MNGGGLRPLPTIDYKSNALSRTLTDLASFNDATLGLPDRTAVEISGYPGTGKSSLAWHLSGVYNPEGDIVAANFEDFDPDWAQRATVQSGFRGNIFVVPTTQTKAGETKMRAAEDVLDDACLRMFQNDSSAMIVDSVGAIVTTAELEGSLAEANMGATPRLVARLMRKMGALLRAKRSKGILFLTNHVHQIMGARGTVTSGGMAIQYLTSMRIRLSKSEEFDYCPTLVVQGRVDRLKFKGEQTAEKNFYVVITPPNGVHSGLTAIWDCKKLGLLDEKEGTSIRLNGKSYGYQKKLLSEPPNDPALYEPFRDALRKHYGAAADQAEL